MNYLLSTLIAIAAVAGPVAGASIEKRNGCYSKGPTWGNIESSGRPGIAAAIRNDACKALGNRMYKGGEEQPFCFSTGPYKAEFSVRYGGRGDMYLNYEDCISAFAIEMNGCEHGSKQWHGDFFYYDDPNDGNC